jgi:xanthine dehydrogenase accessory factor
LVDPDEANNLLKGRAGILLQSEDAPFLQKHGICHAELSALEVYFPKPRLIILGCGHIANALCKVASLLSFDVWAFDDRPYFANKSFLPDAARIVCIGFDALERTLKLNPSDYIAIMTRGHRHDTECLRFALSGGPLFYLGMVGSKRRVLAAKMELEEEGFKRGALDALHAPIGLGIGSITPEEIAVSIAAQMIEVKRGFSAGQGKKTRIDPYADMRILEFLSENKAKCACITVAGTIGSTPREAGAKMLYLSDSRTIGTIGGGCAEAKALAWARDIPASGYRLESLDLSDIAEEDGMVCGGRMDILIERVE